MTNHATGTFDITGWNELATEEREGATVGRILITKAFHGDLEATSTTEILTVATAAGPVAYVGIEHLDGTLGGRKGTFVLQHSAGSDDGAQWMRWQIVPTSGTGELSGLRGEGRIERREDGSHVFTLDYELRDSPE
ncbi:DUF3224 domain-containing protein [Planotetraspora sp. A-T 1434]|uniref:DUF3224 domain-containing protein n=1 Tax=Planotetraspora sp. A-T 1434 TaxID=2979219 RepID=UPI0021BF99E2|nr:DUF3224 domain-containing protein [Planotetraspora sp. A-T 1434]MCT9933073.1 DUF3224 domain-containing protein [Planotetraspora sp. A-T 1434]